MRIRCRYFVQLLYALVNNKHQVFKAAKSINENILHEMPLPTVIREAVRASGKATLSEELYKILTSESGLAENMLNQLNLKSDHEVFKAINHLEAVIFSLKEKYTEQSGNKFLVRTSWSFVKDETTRIDKLKLLTNRAEVKLTFDQPESEVTIIKVIHSDMPEEDRYGNAIVVENMEKG
uniref:Rop guanine nucleotide exchange factor n=1 Tax=Cucumis melo subsp. melo TaxID=412675 RepID=E5GCE7_CUCME|nr:rop guanine nucleotide exchange factor [Cucumis melo subsp. melo]